MRRAPRRGAIRWILLASALALIVGQSLSAPPAEASGPQWLIQKSPNGGVASDSSYLRAAAATSTKNAWAVGYYNNGTAFQTLVEHWNGMAWKVRTSPDPGGSSSANQLWGATATSAKNAWAVGDFNNGTADQTLVEHWNGMAWKVQTSPDVGGSSTPNDLEAVTSTSATNAWAVGYYYNGSAGRTLVEHWNGKAWKVQTSPDVGSDSNQLFGVAATSATNAWAVGVYNNGTADQTLVEHWNGKSWMVTKSPDPSGSAGANDLFGVAATSATSAFAVGGYFNGTAPQNLVEHWNGKAWKVQMSPDPGGSSTPNGLEAVTATSATNAWAVGYPYNGTAFQTLVEHWNGKGWKVQTSPDVGGASSDNQLWGVTATSATNAWAVGTRDNGIVNSTLVEHCC
jgi:hypothetical protein